MEDIAQHLLQGLPPGKFHGLTAKACRQKEKASKGAAFVKFLLFT